MNKVKKSFYLNVSKEFLCYRQSFDYFFALLKNFTKNLLLQLSCTNYSYKIGFNLSKIFAINDTRLNGVIK